DQLFRQRGVPVADTDLLARQVVEPGQPALAEVQQAFGQEIVGPDGRLRRDELARRVFTDPAARKRLEDILHPRIRALWRAQVEAWHAEGRSLAVVVIPLLFETNAPPGPRLVPRTNRAAQSRPMARRAKNCPGRLCHLDRSRP
ncbi:MAG: dephospho-CoA kinase, partial [Verrucomicrobia bacterium]